MLSIVLPTLNEADTLPDVLRVIEDVLKDVAHEVIVVDDDSPDKTWEVAERLKTTHPSLKVLRRRGKKRDLSRAAVEGFAAATGDVLVLMDGDLQHDPAVIHALHACIQKGADVAVASRYAEGGSVGEWVTGRRVLSKIATGLSRRLYNAPVSDPMSGYFAIRRPVYERTADAIRPRGFKILFEILAFLPKETKVDEVPLAFRARAGGASKLRPLVQAEFLWQVLRIAILRSQQWIFWGVTAAVFLSMLPRLWDMRLLYLDTDVRTKVQRALERTAEDKGWLLSDISVELVTRDRVRVTHRQHHRGEDEERCFLLPYEQTKPIPCDPL